MSAGSILFVNDDYEFGKSLSRWFKQKGYDADSTFHPIHRLLLAAERKYDVVVIDVGSESINGLEVLDELIQRQLFPVIVLSDQACPIFVSRALEVGAFDYLVKPSPMVNIESAITLALSSTRNRPDSNGAV